LQDFLELAVSATASGCIYGLIALAYLLMIRPTGIINFAVGEWAMVAAFGGHLLLYRYEWPYFAGMAAVLALMVVVGWVTERIAVRPLVEKGSAVLAPILALLGVLVITREIISVSFPPDPLPVPFPFGIGRLEFGLVGGSYQSFFIIAVTLAVFAGTWFFFEKTLWGRSFEAVALNRRAAALMGMNNVYYRSLHLVSNAEYGNLPARLRMQALANPAVDRLDFELFCLAVSAVNGCGKCLDSHEHELRKRGASALQVQDAIRIASILHAIAGVLDGERALATVQSA